jgi:hypothetical protein
MFYKLAGFLYESFRIETNQVILEGFFSKLNPQIESLKSVFANLDLRVRQPGFVRVRDLGILIFKDLFCAVVLRICEDLLDS